MTTLVTGGAGFIGSHVVKNLLKRSLEVVVLDDLSGGYEENISRDVSFVKGNICDSDLVRSIFEKYEFDFIFHLAAYAAEGLSHFIRHSNYNNVLLGSINLINESIRHHVKCFVFTSSIAVYGLGELPMHEGLIPKPIDPYGIAKYAVELDLQAALQLFGLNYIIFRPHNVYGEFQNIADKYRNVIGIFMNQIMNGIPITIFGDGQQKRAFSYIDEVAPIIASSIFEKRAYNEVFNIGSDDVYTINELAEAIFKEFDVNPEINYQPERKEVFHAYSSHTKLYDVFEKTRRFSLHEGIHNMANWARQVGARKTKGLDRIEINHNLPSIWRS